MYPTVQQVMELYQSLGDDFPQTVTSVFTPQVFQFGFSQAYDAMFAAFLSAQGAKIELMLAVEVAPYTFEATPADWGITNMGEPIFLREKIFGSNERFKTMDPVDVLPQQQPSTYLRWYNWRNNTFYLVGATSLLCVEVKYEASSVAPSALTPAGLATTICVDSCLNFLANYAFGVTGGRKGYEQEAARCMNIAVGPKYGMGTVGGQLFQLIQPSVRNRQNVQISHRPYTTWGRPFSRWGTVPYVAAQQGTSGGGAQNVPIQFSSANGSIIGGINGVNLIFYVNAGNVASMIVFRNGVLQTVGLDYTYIGNMFTFAPASVPHVGDVITAEVNVVNPTNYGSTTGIGPPP